MLQVQARQAPQRLESIHGLESRDHVPAHLATRKEQRHMNVGCATAVQHARNNRRKPFTHTIKPHNKKLKPNSVRSCTTSDIVTVQQSSQFGSGREEKHSKMSSLRCACFYQSIHLSWGTAGWLPFPSYTAFLPRLPAYQATTVVSKITNTSAAAITPTANSRAQGVCASHFSCQRLKSRPAGHNTPSHGEAA